jgi:hypothetical protein
MFPLTFIITKCEIAKQNSTNFESKFCLSTYLSSFSFVTANKPSVSITKIAL